MVSTQKTSATPPEEEPGHQEEEEKQPLAVIPYISGVSEQIRKACEKYNLKVIFKSEPTLRSEAGRCGLPDPLPVW